MTERTYKHVTNYKEIIKLLENVESLLAEAATQLKDKTFWNAAEDIYEIKMQFRQYLEYDTLLGVEFGVH